MNKTIATTVNDPSTKMRGLSITTEATITELPKKEAPALPLGGGRDY
jgi:hypothetical protein